MDWQEIIRSWLAVFVSAGLLLFTILSSRGKAAKDEQDRLTGRIAKVEKELADDGKFDQQSFSTLDARLQHVEAEMKHLPSKDQFFALQTTMTEMKGDMKEFRADLKPLAATVSRIDDFLMNRGGKA